MVEALGILLEGRGAAALLYGAAIGGLLRLLGLTRTRGALAAAVAVAAGFLGGGWAGAHLAALTLGAAGLVARLAAADRAGRPGWRDVCTIGAVASICTLAVPFQSLAGLWQAAAVAAWSAGLAGWICRTVPPPPGGVRYRLPSLRPRHDDGVGAAGLIGAAAATLAVAAAALGLELVGAGEPAPIALGALLGLAPLGNASRRLRLLAATACGALAGSALTAWLT